VNIDELVETLAAWKAAKRDAETEIKRLESELIEALESQGKSKVVTHRATATVVRATRLHIDEERLRQQVDDDTWGRITRQVVDRDKLESAVALDLVNPEVVADCTEERPNKPYVKVTDK